MPGITDIWDYFSMSGKLSPIKDSITDKIPSDALLELHTGLPDLGSNLKGYHPMAGAQIQLKVHEQIDSSQPLKWIQAESYDGNWNGTAKDLFRSIKWVPSPSGHQCFVPLYLDPGIHNTGLNGWILHYARLQGGPDPYRPSYSVEGNSETYRKVVLVWRVEGFDQFVYTCWIWG